MKTRCAWCNTKNPEYIHYHDNVWGLPVYDDQKLFEYLILEGAQAGLSWETILKKQKNYQIAFDNFDPEIVANYDETKLQSLLQNPGIVRNKLKIKSVPQNAQVFIQIQKEFGSFQKYIWQFVHHTPIQNNFSCIKNVPAQTEISQKISKDLKSRGMNFVGPTIIYAYIQAIGMVNDHTIDCFRHTEVKNTTQ